MADKVAGAIGTWRFVGCHIGCHDPRNWRGWMGIEPTQGASAAPRKRF